jgi:toxin CcdB
MPEFALHALRDGGLVVDVQSDLLEPFSTRVVIPLVALEQAPQAPRRLNPVIEVSGAPLILATHLLAALPRATLGLPVGSLAHERDRIRAALDMLFLGF